jgi:hypothetical protein
VKLLHQKVKKIYQWGSDKVRLLCLAYKVYKVYKKRPHAWLTGII